jgi:2-polyprenyl-6-methoxyphenol hydroxylase-like FAD-dependent oxidoreductase
MVERGHMDNEQKSNRNQEEADVLIGADGIHSTVREQLVGFEKPRYAGFTALRGICNL